MCCCRGGEEEKEEPSGIKFVLLPEGSGLRLGVQPGWVGPGTRITVDCEVAVFACLQLFMLSYLNSFISSIDCALALSRLALKSFALTPLNSLHSTNGSTYRKVGRP